MNPLRRIPLFKRFPRVRLPWRADDLVKPEKRNQYPAFAADFETLDQELLPTFRSLHLHFSQNRLESGFAK